QGPQAGWLAVAAHPPHRSGARGPRVVGAGAGYPGGRARGGAAGASRSASSLEALPPRPVARQRASGPPAPRPVSCFRLGVLLLVIGAMARAPLPPARFLPAPWPTAFDQKAYP